MKSNKLNFLSKVSFSNFEFLSTRINWSSIFFFIFLLAILQDYLYSQLKNTGFYIAESSLYNIIWLLFIPGFYFIKTLNLNNQELLNWKKIPIAVAITLLHLFVFSGIFYLLSCLFFSPHHLFITTLKSCTANYLFIMLIAYTILPGLNQEKKHGKPRFRTKISTKQGGQEYIIDIKDLHFIETERPYLALHTPSGKKLYSSTISKLASELDPSIFLKVHRSTIVNVNSISKLISRKNGDYDAELITGQIIRLSRHYKQNWNQLFLNSSST